ncbi:AMP-binding protein [Bacillus pseudomycoides]|nr:AMP-binding protein [Bacillus pseudomycoides]
MAELIKKTIGDLLDEITSKSNNHEAVIYPELDIRWTYREFQNYCNNLAKGLIKLGIKKGDHVAIWANNKPEWLVAQFAVSKIGAVLVTINTNYKAQELEYLLKQSDSTTIILMDSSQSSGNLLDILLDICPEIAKSTPGNLHSKCLPLLKNIILLSDKKRPGVFLWENILNMGECISDEELICRQDSLHPDDIINIQYTSGTTGLPKGVMLSHYNILNNARSVAENMNLTKYDRLCIPVPFFHCFGCVLGVLACVSIGATMIPLVTFNPLKILRLVENEHCTALHGVPTMFISILNHPEFDNYDKSSLRTGIIAGANCPVEIMKQIINKMDITEITIAYGQTETSPVITQTKIGDPIEYQTLTVGRALSNIEVKIINPKNGKAVPYGTPGELCTRGYHIMQGYYNMSSATEEVIDKKGWLHTGDLAVMDEQQYISITGRLKDMIIRGGENVYPKEVEETLYTHPDILDVQVVGVPDAVYGEKVAAFIKVKNKKNITREDVWEFCINKISSFKIPEIVYTIEEYPMTGNKKVRKDKLRELLLE